MEYIPQALSKVRANRPLVHNITNLVVMNTTANALLAIGASPVMAHAKDELEDMLKIASTLVINIGTLDEHWIASMEKAAEIAGKLEKPIVLDPVGAGATRLRTETALNLLDVGAIKALRGNLSEVAALLGEHGKTRGVDSTAYEKDKAKNLATAAAKEFNAVVAVTRPVDYVSNGKEIYAIYNGHELLGMVTGTGCMVTAITGAFIATEEPLRATVSALAIFGIAAEKASEETEYSGSFYIKLYDWLYRIDHNLTKEKAKVERIEP